jgi:phosphoribosylaminoimidazolecarboxamide formyltransferase/IMP cyclohydrolase
VVNLYPFEATVAKPGCTLEDAIENIDIGGPAMVRSAAKNWKDVAVLTDAAQYAGVLAELQAGGKLPRRRVRAVGGRLQPHQQLRRRHQRLPVAHRARRQPEALFPGQTNGRFVKLQDLRYGENPHQQAAFYRDLYPAPGSLVTAEQLQGKELSYNNIADADAAWECVKSFDAATPACVIVKHANPCGVASVPDALQAYAKAFQTDPDLAFGGIIAFNRPLDGAAAQSGGKQFVEVLMAPGFTEEALAVFKAKANVRVLQIAAAKPGGATPGTGPQPHGRQARRLGPADADRRQPRADAGRPEGGDEESSPRRRSCRTCCSPGRWPSTSSPTPSCSARTA